MSSWKEESIVVEVVRYRYNHESVLGEARVIKGPAYVKAHHNSTVFAELTLGLAETGHPFSVSTNDEEICLLEMAERLSRKEGSC